MIRGILSSFRGLALPLMCTVFSAFPGQLLVRLRDLCKGDVPMWPDTERATVGLASAPVWAAAHRAGGERAARPPHSPGLLPLSGGPDLASSSVVGSRQGEWTGFAEQDKTSDL